MWWNPGHIQDALGGLQPTDHYEDVETKRRLNNIIHVSGLIDHLTPVKARPATKAELRLVHTAEHIENIQKLSSDSSKGYQTIGHDASMSHGGFEIAALAAGASIALTDAALDGRITNGYALTRPPGHHAEPDRAMGYCVFNNIAIAAKHALENRDLKRVAVVDYDVHHGNGTQKAFYEDDRVLFISLHQDSNYPIGSGPITDVGAGAGTGYTINVPLPPGSGSGAYRAAFDRVVVPALDALQPELILVSSGFDASFRDPLSAQMCGSHDYRYFTSVMKAAAARHCGGKLLFFHEGGYSAYYVPFCGLAVVEELAGVETGVVDPELEEHCKRWGYQDLQPWQDALIQRAEEGPLALLKQQLQQRASN